MPDLIIKDVPVGAEDFVRRAAVVGIERYLNKENQMNVKGLGTTYKFVDVAAAEAFKVSIDDIYVANGLDKKFNPDPPELQ